MRFQYGSVRWAVTGLSVALILLATACGGDDKAPAAVAPAAAPSAAAQQDAARPINGSASGVVSAPARIDPADEPVTAITILATDNAYDPSGFQIRAGEEVTVTVENRGQAIHDWRIRGVTNAGGKDIGTRLLYAGEQETITVVVDQTGEYAFYCEVHAVEMRGTLNVQ
jgi:plastocyanin